MNTVTSESHTTTEEAFEAEIGFPITEASQSDYERAHDNLNDAVNALVSPFNELEALLEAGFDELADKLKKLCAANMAMDCAKEHL